MIALCLGLGIMDCRLWQQPSLCIPSPFLQACPLVLSSCGVNTAQEVCMATCTYTAVHCEPGMTETGP